MMKITIDGKEYKASPYSKEPREFPPAGFTEDRSVSIHVRDLPFAKSTGTLFINKDRTLVQVYASGSFHPYYIIVEGL